MTSNVASTVITTTAAALSSSSRVGAAAPSTAAVAAKLLPEQSRRASVAVTAASKIPVMADNVLALKNKLQNDLTHAIQMAQKFYLERNDGENRVIPLTNSDYQVHELCQQFDFIFLYGLKAPDEGFWKFLLEFTHKNVLAELTALLNVTTSFGKGRAWIYHALNDNLMESYLRWILENKKIVLKFYKRETALIADDQAISVMVTLVAGLENIEFKLHNDVPYLDHSCWPTHLNVKRRIVDSILNGTSDPLSQIVNGTLNYRPAGAGSDFDAKSLEIVMNTSQALGKSKYQSSASKMVQQRQAALHRPKSQSVSNNGKNDFSFDNSTTSSNNNLSDINANTNDKYDEGSETSGRYTAKTMLSTPRGDLSPQSVSEMNTTPDSSTTTTKKQESANQLGNLKKSSENLNSAVFTDFLSKQRTQKYRTVAPSTKKLKHRKKQNEVNFQNDSNESSNSEEEASGSMATSASVTRSSLIYDNVDDEKQQIDNEINKLRQENSLLIESSSKLSSSNNDSIASAKHSFSAMNSKSTIRKSGNRASPSTSSIDLVSSSLKASNYFDAKIEHLENYSNIIEDATSKMDECVKDMTAVYENFEDYYSRSPQPSSSIENQPINDETRSLVDEKGKKEEVQDELDVYNYTPDESANKQQQQMSSAASSQVNNLAQNMQDELTMESNTSSVYDSTEQPSSTLLDKKLTSIDSSVESSQAADESMKLANENNYLNVPIKLNEIKLEILVDNNTKLMLMIDIFQNGQNEELIKFYHASRGHSQGELENIYVLLTSHGIYMLLPNESMDDNGYNGFKTNPAESLYKRDTFIHHNQIDFIEVSLGDQAIHFVCRKKAQNCWITTACRKMTNDFLANVHVARKHHESLRLPEVSVFREPMQQTLAIKKFIANEENLSSVQNIELKNYSLVYWEDQATAVSHLIHKEGLLYHMSKSGGSVDWKKSYFVLKNDVLTQFKSPSDKRPTQVIKLNGEDFSGCRKSTNSTRPYAIELILSNSNRLYLAAKNEAEASDWLQCFCKIISLGNYHTDVPSHSCLPCCSVLTTNKLYFCHEDLQSGFYRLLEPIKLQEINRISFDTECTYFCILHDDYENKSDNKKPRYWFVYFVDENERNIFITSLKEAWESLFQVPFTIEKCKSSEMRKRCIRGVNLVHKYWASAEDY